MKRHQKPTIRVPTLQHLARNWRPDASAIQRALVQLAKHPPVFSYSPLNDAIRDMFVFGVTGDEVVRGFEAKEKRAAVRANFLQILPLAIKYVEQMSPEHVLEISPQYYALSRDILIPFKPPMLLVVGGKAILPWFTYWRTNPLSRLQQSLFISVVQELLNQNPDLEDAELHLIDFCAPTKGMPRALRTVIPSPSDLLPRNQQVSMLTTFAEGFALARIELSNGREAEHSQEQPALEADVSQLELLMPSGK